MTSRERRKYVRINRQFVTQLFKPKGEYETEGVTENISLGGAYVKVKDWRSFQAGDQAIVTLLLPPSFTDRDKTLGLRGDAIVRRIDYKNEGIALEFSKNFQQFERIEVTQIAGKSRYKSISYYLHSISRLEFVDFIRANPNGVLVEKSGATPENNAVFQFTTLLLDVDHAMQELKRDFSVGSVETARVIEVKKRKFDPAKNTITVGRAATNDIVIHNNLVSKSHAYLYVHPSSKTCYLVDCGSRNGTLLNGKVLKPFEKYQVADCDEICFGPQTKITYFSSIAFANFINQLRTAHPRSDT